MAGTGSRLLDQLMDALRCLPGVGPRSAQRIAYHLLQRDREGGRRLARVLDEAADQVCEIALGHGVPLQAVMGAAMRSLMVASTPRSSRAASCAADFLMVQTGALVLSASA